MASGTVTFKATSSELLAKSEEFYAEKEKIAGYMETVKGYINSLGSLWESSASTEFTKKFGKTEDDVTLVLNMIAEYVSDLQDSAAIYEITEKNALELNQALPEDGVFDA